MSNARIACCLALALSACVPWYRTEESRAIRAQDPKAMTALLARCKAMSGEARIDCYKGAVQRDPRNVDAKHDFIVALFEAKRYAEVRAFLDASADQIAHPPAGFTLTSDQRTTERTTNGYYFETYKAEGLPALAILRSNELDRRAGFSDLSETDLTVSSAASSFPEVFGKLDEAQNLATGGKTREALDKYAEWLDAYGVPDLPMVQRWADGVLTPCAPLVAGIVQHGDEAAQKESWAAALASYGAAFRYMPAAAFDASVADKLIAASSHVSDPSLLSPVASEAAAAGDTALEANNIGEAIRSYRRAVSAAPGWAEARYNLAVLLASVEAYDAAVNQMDWYLALDPSSERAQKATDQERLWRALSPSVPEKKQ